MTTDEILRRLLELASEVGEYAPGDLDGVAYEQADLITQLHDSLWRGGPLPAEWQR